MNNNLNDHPLINKKTRLERLIGILAILTIIIAWVVGFAREQNSFEDYLTKVLPDAASFNQLSSGIYEGLADDGVNVIGYVASGKATGYGGPMEIAVSVDPEGEIIGLAVVDHKETPSYLERVFNRSFVTNILGKTYSDEFELGNDLDGVTSATYTSTAIANAVKLASQQVAQDQLGRYITSERKPDIIFGAPEILLAVLFVVGYLGRKRILPKTKIIRWGTMLAGMVGLGFIYNRPLTISKINMFLMGYFPEWQTNLYWYFLLGGIIFVFAVDNRNPYCEWFCPFGAAQECMSAIGGAKQRFTRRQQAALDWIQRGVAWLAIIIALLFRNPGITSYEIFGTLFQFHGGLISFVILGIVLLASLISHRFWCKTLCPIRPVEGIIRLFRGWIVELWKNRRIKTNR